MIKTETVRARIDPHLKTEVETLLGTLGLSMSDAIQLFLHQVRLHHGLPFDVKIPNALTRKTFETTDQEKDLSRGETVQDFLKTL